jgi:hypothetical protein
VGTTSTGDAMYRYADPAMYPEILLAADVARVGVS